eukprot:TRINITY_DN3022_c0_g1_i3.p1 TRINITY_DN3022_c0_g1~~TRINITY_DN3022_c0_g1_i3.p1  ORF type:complete len:816 (-),score=158.12 TRINITY_DN3022_c0_g1_i3:1863-4310(-)
MQKFVELEQHIAVDSLPEVRADVVEPTDTFVPDIILIGAGPIGLWTAIQIKIRSPQSEILLIEKYKEYQRKHVLMVHRDSLHGVPDHPLLQEFCKSVSHVIRTSELEARLLVLAKTLGIRLEFRAVNNVQEDIIARYPRARCIIGADGAHSIVRKQIFDDKMPVNDTLAFIIDCKYEVYGQARKFRLADQGYRTMKLIPFLAQEFVGKEKEGVTPVTCRLVVNEEAFNSAKDASFRAPFRLYKDLDRLHPDIQKSLRVWLNAKTMAMSEIRVPGSESLTAVRLSVYRASKLGTTITATEPGAAAHKDAEFQHAVFLVGDSACGVPFFRALNNGLMCGTELAKHVAKMMLSFDSNPHAASEAVRAYNKEALSMCDGEISKARLKKVGLNLGEFGVRISSRVPWQINTWGAKFIKAANGPLNIVAPLPPPDAAPDAAPPVTTPPVTAAVTHSGDTPVVDALTAAMAVLGGDEAEDPFASLPDHMTCPRCEQVFNPRSNPIGQCSHRGTWHSQYKHCTAGCASGLTLNGLAGPPNKLGTSHWSCCFSVEEKSLCSMSLPHVVTGTACTQCTRLFDPACNMEGECSHLGVWHDQFSHCTPMCGLKLNTRVGNPHWSCCYSTVHTGPCEKSPIHSCSSTLCAHCGRSYDVAANPKGACGHGGLWHSQFKQCGPACLLHLMPLKLGKAHWSCCYETVFHSTCHKSAPHRPLAAAVLKSREQALQRIARPVREAEEHPPAEPAPASPARGGFMGSFVTSSQSELDMAPQPGPVAEPDKHQPYGGSFVSSQQAAIVSSSNPASGLLGSILGSSYKEKEDKYPQ